MELRAYGLCLLSACSFACCHGRHEQVHPLRGTVTESVYASGIIKSDEQYQVFANANGLLSELYVTEGDKVKQGDILFRVSDMAVKLNEQNARLAADYASSSANRDRLQELLVAVDQAAIRLSNDSLLLKRQQKLWSQDIGSRNDLEQRELAWRNSRNNYEAALLRYQQLQRQISFQEQQSRKALEIARTASGDYIVKSEVDGKVYSVLKKKGEMVNPQTPVAIIGQAGRFLAELQVDEFDIARVHTGMKTLLTMDSYKGQVFEAVISKIYPLMNSGSKTFTVEAVFTKAPPVLYPNLTCEANIMIREQPDGITIPATFLLPGDSVLLKDGRKIHVTTGARDYRTVEILKGLTDKDIILKPE